MKESGSNSAEGPRLAVVPGQYCAFLAMMAHRYTDICVQTFQNVYFRYFIFFISFMPQAVTFFMKGENCNSCTLYVTGIAFQLWDVEK